MPHFDLGGRRETRISQNMIIVAHAKCARAITQFLTYTFEFPTFPSIKRALRFRICLN